MTNWDDVKRAVTGVLMTQPNGEPYILHPALTPEEWAQRAERWPDHLVRGFASQLSTALGRPEDIKRHALAAFALYGQLFGFTYEDIALIRSFASWAEGETYYTSPSEAVLLSSIADRIAALLPPK